MGVLNRRCIDKKRKKTDKFETQRNQAGREHACFLGGLPAQKREAARTAKEPAARVAAPSLTLTSSAHAAVGGSDPTPPKALTLSPELILSPSMPVSPS